MKHQNRKTTQRGGFVVGLIIGLLIGLSLALGVALYVTKVPVPFVNKVPQRTPGQDAAEAEKNKNWDPNSPLYGKNPARPASEAGTAPPPALPGALPPAIATAPMKPGANGTSGTSGTPATSAAAPASRASAPAGARDPAAILGDKPARETRLGAAGSDPFTYFVQAGAYGRTEDAEAQRAKLAMLGLEGKLTEREQAGRTMYRVRVGPFDRKADADATKAKLDGAGIDAALVRVQR